MKWLTCFLGFLISIVTFGQTAKIDSSAVLVQLKSNAKMEDVLEELPELSAYSINEVRQISRNLNAYKITFEAEVSPIEVMDAFETSSKVLLAQKNHIITQRSTPNDSLYNRLWHLNNTGSNGPTGIVPVAGADIAVEPIWDSTVGGTTVLGDTIVVCVVDDGIDANHEDFQGNLWVNHNEIDSNGVDDDGNGYIDDYRGWNAYAQDGSLTNPVSGDYGYHGTRVSGIIGARGDNSIGITGVNQRVKIMTVVGGGDEAEALAAYDYPLTMRKIWNETQGDSGAFIVATNTSWGTDYGQASEAPLWCAMYDSMGQAGILNTAATINADIDVDVYGDLPTTCPSDYLIAVTNTTARDEKADYSGYGVENIDIGAPGEDVYSTTFGSGYGYDNGTSFASPQVAGAIALLYSKACEDYIMLAYSDPADAAYWMRDFILNGAVGIPDLYGITVSQGRLDVEEASNWLENYCTGNVSVEEFDQENSVSLYPNPTTNKFNIQQQVLVYNNLVVFDLTGKKVAEYRITTSSFELDISLWPEGMYILQLTGTDGLKTIKLLKN